MSFFLLHDRLKSGSEYHPFVVENATMRGLLHLIEQVAPTNSAVLLTGESGVGKELFAEQLHLKSGGADKPFVRMNCVMLSPSSLESELFGHAQDAVVGHSEAFGGGTLFLDEIGALSLDLQARLFQVLQTRSLERAESSAVMGTGMRIVAATSRNLEQLVACGTFRSDLYHRLNVLPIHVPPLRERKEDIEPIAMFFLRKYSCETKKRFEGFSPAALRALLGYYWPGNVRELKNSVEHACVFGTPPLVQVADLRIGAVDAAKSAGDDFEAMASDIASSDDKTLHTALTRFKRAYVIKILTENAWNQTRTAKILDVQRTYVARLLNELHIR